MSNTRKRPMLGGAIYATVMFALGSYFTFAAVQGDYGLFRRIQAEAEADTLRAEKASLEQEIALLSNKTRRLSDDYLDLDLLDERARDVLGLMRPDELVVR
ncbi:FtsB family cell division protein [Actibacterium sp. XHP0104]|uniref:FtsB family cell division protein n=1 Tax=Actibacterium sp. XHP0104 TaxID=2984335 RepID=UPI0021E94565|nr:septum formation initiator family protein [Actibacterium sp. XHP0104]MCV2880996.1 septum formation initiator family protein [Actibacterium sp. XHP0104]